ncbi:uncharacterized protein [Lepeophtheirus salmonis]|uniref:uncharacterized protein n=1 Tax=Lepeophtheirus salmonis TaxID=72036 RepID=UPI001AE64105|nr:uncharacterized protein LOC121125486 [Lepeophtheirus salmonis]
MIISLFKMYTNYLLFLIVSFVLVQSNDGVSTFDKDKGLYLGELLKEEAGLSAKLYALSPTLILLSDLQIDLDVSGVFIFAGTLNEDGTYTKVGYPLQLLNGKVWPLHIIMVEMIEKIEETKGESPPLYVLKFPNQETIRNVDWIAAISRKKKEVLSRILINEEVIANIPQSKILTGLKEGNNLISPNLLYSDQKTIEVLDFNFDPSDDEIIFRAIMSEGSMIDNEMLICSKPLHDYENETVTLRLPDSAQSHRVKALELYSLKKRKSVTYTIFSPEQDLTILPPSLVQLGLLHNKDLKNQISFSESCDDTTTSPVTEEKVTSTTTKPLDHGYRKRIPSRFEHFPNAKKTQAPTECESDCEKEDSKDMPKTTNRLIRRKFNRGSTKNRKLTSIRKVPRKALTLRRNQTKIDTPFDKDAFSNIELEYPKKELNDEDDEFINDKKEELISNESPDEGYSIVRSEDRRDTNRPYPKYKRRNSIRPYKTQSSFHEEKASSELVSDYQEMNQEDSKLFKPSTTSQISRNKTINFTPHSPSLSRFTINERRQVSPNNRFGLNENRTPLRRRRPNIQQSTETMLKHESLQSFQDKPMLIRNRGPPQPFASQNAPYKSPTRDTLMPRSDDPQVFDAQEFDSRSRPDNRNPIQNFFSFISKPRHWFQGQNQGGQQVHGGTHFRGGQQVHAGQQAHGAQITRLEEPLLNLKRNRDTMALLNQHERSKVRQQHNQRIGEQSFQKRFLTPFPIENTSKRLSRPKIRMSSRMNNGPLNRQSNFDEYQRDTTDYFNDGNFSVTPHELLSMSVLPSKNLNSPQNEQRFDPQKITSESGFKPIIKGPGNQPILAFNVLERRSNAIRPQYHRKKLSSSLVNNYENRPQRPPFRRENPRREYLDNAMPPQISKENERETTFIYPYSPSTTPIPATTLPVVTTNTPRKVSIGLKQLPRYRVEQFNSADFDSFTRLPSVKSTHASQNDDYYQPYDERDRIDNPNQPLLYSN